ncbi:hypothetical protein RCL_jg18696.t1 [Rhizophagus clarus]|uniref:Uncharacterized protein n=1 Tax=Rhizophagus clarus TaxID=94130 RepID=A0A8H3LHY3_9GLOM|nr:hypothetical protein RCL_jg18696.t1 [Rhizophagus clarus]
MFSKVSLFRRFFSFYWIDLDISNIRRKVWRSKRRTKKKINEKIVFRHVKVLDCNSDLMNINGIFETKLLKKKNFFLFSG